MLSSLLTGTLMAALSLGFSAQPVRYVTRADAVTRIVLARTPDVPFVRNDGRFADVPRNALFEPYMLYAERIGIISPDATGKLRPEASVTRAEYLKMLSTGLGLPSFATHAFRDVPGDAWYAPYAGIAQRHNVFHRTAHDLLEPQRAVTHDEMLHALQAVMSPTVPDPAIKQEQDVAAGQAQGNLQLYSVISTRYERVQFATYTLAESSAPAPAPTVAIPPSLPELRTQILTQVNAIRLQYKLTPLTYDSRLEQSAQGYADRMVREGFFTHVAPDGQTMKERIAATGYYDRSFSMDCMCQKGYALGENLARGQKTAKEAVDAWMKSPSHRAAILNPDYAHTGIGAKAGYWVQHFGGVLLPE